jgi:hypothetical protein
MVLGWRGYLPAKSTGTNSQTITYEYKDLFFALGIATASVSAAAATLTSPFASVRVKKIEAWELNGNPLALTLSQSQVATTFTSGQDVTVADSGSSAIPSYVSISPKLGSIAANWFSGNTSTNLFIVNVNTDSINATGSNALSVAIRVHLNYTLNDADASPATVTTSSNNTVSAGLMYFRQISFSGNNLQVDAQPSVGTYIP